MSTAPSIASGTGQLPVVLFPEGPGYVFMDEVARTDASKIFLVKSLEDGKQYIRKESMPGYWSDTETIQNEDVRMVRRLGNIGGVSKLIGWIDYLDERQSRVVSVSYWELCNGGTLLGFQEKMVKLKKKVPDQCLWSIFEQMMRIMIDIVKAGVLHTDSHMGNWLLHLKPGSHIPQLVLADWGRAELKPNGYFSENSVRKWWDLAHHQFDVFLVGNMRSLMLQGSRPVGTLRKHFDRIKEDRSL